MKVLISVILYELFMGSVQLQYIYTWPFHTLRSFMSWCLVVCHTNLGGILNFQWQRGVLKLCENLDHGYMSGTAMVKPEVIEVGSVSWMPSDNMPLSILMYNMKKFLWVRSIQHPRTRGSISASLLSLFSQCFSVQGQIYPKITILDRWLLVPP